MTETFVFNIAETIFGKISRPIFEELSLAWGIKDDLQRLKNTMSSVYAVLLDAQEKQETNHQLRDWLGKLSQALYDAEIVLDEFEMDALRLKVSGQNIGSKVKKFFSCRNQVAFRFKMTHKIKKIREEFDEVAADRNKFNLIERYEERVLRRRELTHSFIRPEDVIGRDNDIEDVIAFLLERNGNENVSVLPIVGLGGMGKTSLSKVVFNDKKVLGNFELRLWQCVSEEFDLLLIVKKILKSLGIENCDNFELEQLQIRLREKLDDKKYFLILDDVWNENRAKWVELKNLLIGGAKGSKIIVTTRSKSVASTMSTNGCIKEIKGLSHEEGLSLFLKWSFRSFEDSKNHPKLVEIAEDIVKKCKGVPLAIKTLGNILYLKTEIHDWLHVRDNDVWKLEQKEDDILPALKLSYRHLPTSLRRCFSFCSLFPKDHLFDRDLLIDYWSTNGLLKISNYDEDVHIIGIKYIEQLWSLGFFQEFQEWGTNLEFKMHDLVHDLALLVAEPDIVCIDSQEVLKNRITRKVRHLSFSKNYLMQNEPPNWLLEQNGVRTIHFALSVEPRMTTFVETCISKFKLLHFLDLGNSNLEALPNSIGRLKHLRYLNLNSNFEITCIPDSICELVGLEVLYFNGCPNIINLPKGLGKLTRLRHLGLTTHEISLPDKEFQNLTSLKKLIISNCLNLKFLFSDITMFHLSSLRELSIGACERLESLPTKALRQLPCLEILSIRDCTNLQFKDNDNDFRCDNELLHLRILELDALHKLMDLPLWLIEGAKNVKTLIIGGYDNFTNVMLERMVKNVKYLERLELNRCWELSSLPDGMQNLTALTELVIIDCPGLETRCQREVGEDWKNISHIRNIYVRSCFSIVSNILC